MSSYNFERAKKEYLNRQSQGNSGQFLIFIVSIILIIVGVYINSKNQDFIKNAKTTTGIAYYERNSSKSTSESDYYDVYVKYTVNGKEYYERLKSEELSGVSFSKKSGKEITIYYNPENPAQIKDNSSNYIGIIVIGIGIVIFLVVIGDFIYRKSKGIKMNDPTPNKTAAEKVADFWENVDNNTGLFDKMEKAEKIVLNVKRIIGIIIGIIIIVFGLFNVIMDNSFSKNSKETKAYVSRIEQVEKRDSNNKRYIDTEVYVRYNIDEKVYEKKLNISPSNLTQGSTVTIFYNVDNPNEIKTTNKMQFTGFIIIAVGVFILIAFLLFGNNYPIKE